MTTRPVCMLPIKLKPFVFLGLLRLRSCLEMWKLPLLNIAVRSIVWFCQTFKWSSIVLIQCFLPTTFLPGRKFQQFQRSLKLLVSFPFSLLDADQPFRPSETEWCLFHHHGMWHPTWFFKEWEATHCISYCCQLKHSTHSSTFPTGGSYLFA